MNLDKIYNNIRNLLPKQLFTYREPIEETPPRIYELDYESLEPLKVTQWNERYSVYTLLSVYGPNSHSFRDFLEEVEKIVGNYYNVPKERGQAHYLDENTLSVDIWDSHDPKYTLELEINFNEQQLKAQSKKNKKHRIIQLEI